MKLSTTSILLATLSLLPSLIAAQTTAHCSSSLELCKTLQLADAHSALSVHVPAIPLGLQARGGSGDWSMAAPPTTEEVGKMTNGERFRRGLGPAKPKKRGSSTRRESPAPSPVPRNTFRGVIKVTRADNDAFLGHVSKISFSRAQLRYTPNLDDALQVSFGLPLGQMGGQGLELSVENSDIPNFPFLSLVQGRDSTSSDVGPGSFNYLYLGTSDSSSLPATVGNSYTQATGNQRTSETSVFQYDPTTSSLTATYRNTDGSMPSVMVFSQGTALYFGGDVAQFNQRYPSETIPVRFTFVESSTMAS